MEQKVSKQGNFKVRNVYAFRGFSWQNFNICAVNRGKNFNICAVKRGENFNICAVNRGENFYICAVKDGEMLDFQKIKYYLCRNLTKEGNGLE
ncbi:MAG: hypothetical protein ACI30M_04080 [Muribaculaceae bacterium]